MRVVHIESGLGNQMLSFCELLALQKMNPKEICYIETIIYEIPEASEYICQWNGYELQRIFGIKALNVKQLFSDEEWKKIIAEVTQSQFWKKNWNYPVYITEILNRHGLQLTNIRGDFEKNQYSNIVAYHGTLSLAFRIKQSGIYCNLRTVYQHLRPEKFMVEDQENLFYNRKGDIFTGQRLLFKYSNNNIEAIESEIRKVFLFTPFIDNKNLSIAEKITNCESVAIHARRGDMLTVNGKYYKSGYFRRAVKYIRKHVQSPVFFFFCDPGSIEWCKQNEGIFGLELKKDNVFFIDWNKENESYRDMQLMAMCRHNIITNSSFGWWGAFFNQNQDKITISPEIAINTTHHC